MDHTEPDDCSCPKCFSLEHTRDRTCQFIDVIDCLCRMNKRIQYAFEFQRVGDVLSSEEQGGDLRVCTVSAIARSSAKHECSTDRSRATTGSAFRRDRENSIPSAEEPLGVQQAPRRGQAWHELKEIAEEILRESMSLPGSPPEVHAGLRASFWRDKCVLLMHLWGLHGHSLSSSTPMIEVGTQGCAQADSEE
jgi:hypothetical protein